jgi:hypothetical protein
MRLMVELIKKLIVDDENENYGCDYEFLILLLVYHPLDLFSEEFLPT